MRTTQSAGKGTMFHTSPGGQRVRAPFLMGLLGLSMSAFVTSNTACTAVLGHTVDQCTSNQDCTKFSGTNFCRKTDNTCQPLITSDCPYVYGNYKSDNAIYFGAVISLTGSYGDNNGYKPFEAAVRTALDDFDKTGGGLPAVPGTGGLPRPLVGIICDDKSAEEDDNATVLRSARHLVQTVGVPAIIGTPSTSTTIAMATEVTIPGGTFTISPSATGEDITLLPDYPVGKSAEDGLLWRTAPSDTYQAQAIAAYLQQRLIPSVRTSTTPAIPPGKVKILTFFRGDSYGLGLRTTFNESDAFKSAIGSENYREFNYGTGDNAPSNTDVQAQIKGFAPNIILAFGLGETATYVVDQAEKGWDASTGHAPRPFYVASEGIASPALQPLVNGNPDLQKRILYTSPQLGTVENNAFLRFKDNFTYFADANYPPDQATIIKGTAGWFGLAGTYDSVYLIAYALTSLGAGGSGARATGEDIVHTMKKLTSGETAELYRARITQASNTLRTGGTVKVSGASGPLAFDLKTGDVAADIPIACLDIGGSTQSAGLVYRTESKTIEAPPDSPNGCGYTPP